MPKLCQMRIVAAGHRDAWMDDLSLEFVDGEGRPVDTTIWGRNGAGKTSILNLFFCNLLPSKHSFLGARAEGQQRRLEDYLDERVPAVVACEWDLSTGGAALFGREEKRHITGVLYEKKGSSGGRDSRLRRLYFSGPVDREEPRLTLEELPIFIEQPGGERSRRRLASFREEWQQLREQYPHHSLVAITDTQREWREHLDNLGLDPELWRHQIKMNLREGGAQDMFRFKESEEFADFLLEMAQDPSGARHLSENIDEYEEQLRRRQTQWLPERDLTRGLIERMDEMAEVAEERDELRGEMSRLNADLQGLRESTDDLLEREKEQATKLRAREEEENQRAENARREARQQRIRGAVLERFGARLARDEAQERLSEAREREAAAQRSCTLWRAAVPLSEAIRHERAARGYRERLEELTQQNRPLLEELKETARQFHSALSFRIQELRRNQAESDAAAREKQKEADEARSRADSCRQEQASLRAEAKNTRRDIAGATQERERLVEHSVLGEEESVVDAVSRLEGEVEQTDGRSGEIKEGIEKTETQRQALTDRREELQIELKDAKSQLDRIETDLEKALEKKRQIENSIALREALEVEQLDLHRLPEGVEADLDEALSELLDQIVRLRTEDAQDERGETHLGTHGLLPPSPNAEKVLQELREHLPDAWSGWEYIAGNQPDNAARRRTIERLPHLATGVVVRDQDMDRVRDTLDGAELELNSPVFVGPQGLLFGDGEVEGQVFGPASDAYFDRTAGEQELELINQRRESRAQEISSRKRQREDLQQAVSRLEDYREEFGAAWFKKQNAHRDETRKGIEWIRGRIQSTAETLEEAQNRMENAREELEALRERKGILERSMESARDYRWRCEQHLAEWRKSVTECERRLEQLEQEAVDLEERVEKHRQRADAHRRQAQDFGERARGLETRRDDLQYVREELPEPSEGDCSLLQDEYQRFKRQYEAAVDETGLLHMAEQEEQEAREQRKKCRRELRDSDIGMDEVEEETEALSGLDQVEDRRERAEKRRDRAWSACSNAQQNLDRAVERLKETEQKCEKLGEVPELTTQEALSDSEEAWREAQEARRKAEKLQSGADDHAAQAEEAAKQADIHEKSHQLLSKDVGSLQQLAYDYEGLLDEVEPESRGKKPGGPPVSTGEVEDRIASLRESLRSARERGRELDERRQSCTDSIREFAGKEQFTGLDKSVNKDFARCQEEPLERNVREWKEQLQVRLDRLEEAISDLDTHRKTLASELCRIGEDGIRLLKRARSGSRLPEDVPGMGGMHFLSVTTHEPKDRGERRARMSDLLDRFVDEGNIPTGIELVKRAVRHLAGQIGFTVLHPDPEQERRIKIPEVGRFSGGEQLTCAVLLYCTLARLRARQRGTTAQATGTLLLDNPIGSSSRVKFLQIQRRVAEAMKVQLVYTTAVNDPEALGTFPNLIRLRNQRFDRSTGNRVVEKGTGEDAGCIETARVGWDERDESVASQGEKSPDA